MTISGYAAMEPGGKYQRFEYEPRALGTDEVEIAVSYCGICHSDLSMQMNDWQMTQYPFVGGHEVAGTICQVGEGVRHLQVGQRVGLGWTARSCMVCEQCLTGHQNRCPEAEGTIVQRHGGFADRVRAQAAWVIPIPEGVDLKAVGPLFCGGLTVFNPLLQNNIRPTDHVAVVGIGGLGHMAIAFADAWGCEVTAFSTSPDKESEARRLGADHFLNTRDTGALESVAGRFDMVLVTVNVPLDWDQYVNALRPGGKLHLVGAVPQVAASVFPLLGGERSIGGSPTGSIATAAKMLQFCSRHHIEPIIETFPMSEINAAMDHLASGKARYRIVLQA